MRRLLLALAVLATAVLWPGTAAWAHNTLVAAVPAQDATLTSAPSEVSLRFVETLNPDFTTIAISDAAKQRVAASAPVVDAATGTVAISQPLANGVYTVAYRVVSKDGHVVQGAYRFTVADPAAPAPSSAATLAAAPASTPASGTAHVGVIAGAGAAAAIILILGAALVIRRRRVH